MAAEESRRFAWLALDRGDNDPNRFFLYVIEALRALAPAIGEQSEAILRAPGVSVVDDVLPTLINELDALDASVLVIEDYHLITSTDVHEAVTVLLDHALPLELVLSTRVEPPLPIARLRARGELLEISAADLGFDGPEAAALLNEHQKLNLDPADVSRLVERTEGWPAGLYLAALSLRGRSDVHAFIETFAGDDRNVVDYLTTEVLAGQPAEIYDFLLRTSVLGRLCPALCDEVSGSRGSAEKLRRIEAANAFLVALDNRREWYRYHQLFRDLLHNELRGNDPDQADDANRRAAKWFGEHGDTSEAILHTIAAGDITEAVEMVAFSWRPVAYAGGHQTVQGWLHALPREVHRGDARLCVASAVTAIGIGRHDAVAPWIELASRISAAGPFYDGFTSGVAAADCLRSANAWLTGDLTGCRASALNAIQRGDGPSPWDAFTYTWLGASTFWLGNSAEGIAHLETALELCRTTPVPVREDGGAPHEDDDAHQLPGGATAVACLGMLGLVHLLQGDMDKAQERTDAARSLSVTAGLEEYWVNTAAHVARADLLGRAGRADDAVRQLDRALEVARRGSGPVETTHALVARGLAARAAGDVESARVHIAHAESVLRSCPDPGPVVLSLAKEARARLPMARRQSALSAPMIEDFSERELQVLRLLGGTLSQREIGDALFISFNTVKTHSKSIYRKLGVSKRTEAVGRARELHLI